MKGSEPIELYNLATNNLATNNLATNNLATNIGETTNLADKEPERVASMNARLAEFLEHATPSVCRRETKPNRAQ